MMKVLPGLTLDPYYLNQDQVDFFNENGYLVVERLFSEEECDAISKIVRKQADENFSAILNPDRVIDEIRSVMKAPKIVSILETLTGSTVVGLMSQFLFKEAGSPYASQAWKPHQDNSYPRTPNGEYVTINLALQDQDVENGCLFIYPGSHEEGLFAFEPTKSYRENPDNNPGNTVDHTILQRFEDVRTDLIIKKGGALFMQGNCIHGSYPNVSDRSRPLLSISYIPKGTYYVPGENANRIEISLDL